MGQVMSNEPKEFLSGAGRHISAEPGAWLDPETERDMSLLSQAVTKLRARITAKRIAKVANTPADLRLLSILKSLQRDMMRSKYRSARLTTNQRALVCRILGITELPPLRAAQTPAVLQNLPLKPPGRR